MGAIYTGSFELRRAVLNFTRAPAGGTSEDQMAFTVHYAKLTGGAPDSNWLTADYNAVEVHWDTWFTTMKPNFPPWLTWLGIRWYKDGPAWSPIDRGDGPPNPAVRTSVFGGKVGTGALAQCPPPQVATSFTKVVDERKRWGRAYLPCPIGGVLTSEGRLTNTYTDLIVSATLTCFNSSRAAGKQPVVWSRARSAYVGKRGAIGAHGASAYEITAVLADNLPDIIRSRRWGAPTRRTQTNVT